MVGNSFLKNIRFKKGKIPRLAKVSIFPKEPHQGGNSCLTKKPGQKPKAKTPGEIFW